jgi:3-hydroxy-9,10-secoandrosta-1,3,5(10)-triene-9,17-dione monooxygenase reductase component
MALPNEGRWRQVRTDRLSACQQRIAAKCDVDDIRYMTTLTSPPVSTVHDLTPETMKATMGAFCSGVVVVTALNDHPGAEPLGFTCQSFTSLSLDPPLISINPARSSTTWPRIRDVGRFAVNILAEDHAHLSNRFAKSGTDKYAGVAWSYAPNGSPILDGVSAWIECSIWREYDGGDHTVVVGEVTAMSHDPARNPLIYYRGSYPTANW